ncbi:MAG: four helix bundle protein [Phycisphaerales bacterium]|nr:four helix bundle protein [Phycisphaerales bacterium]
MQDYRKLLVWKKAHEAVLAVYAATRAFPNDERFGLTSQLRRAAASVPLNIAESCGYSSDRARANAIQHAIASSCEVEYALTLSASLGYLNEVESQSLISQVAEVRRMLISLNAFLRKEHAESETAH